MGVSRLGNATPFFNGRAGLELGGAHADELGKLLEHFCFGFKTETGTWFSHSAKTTFME